MDSFSPRFANTLQFTSPSNWHLLQITPEIEVTELDGMSIDEKGCLDRNENDRISHMSDFLATNDKFYFGQLSRNTTLWSNFSTSGCYAECMLQFAAFSCSCLPWTYPQFNLPVKGSTYTELNSIVPCDMRGNQCFLERYFNFQDISCPVCDRLQSCGRIFYRRSVTARKASAGREWCGN